MFFAMAIRAENIALFNFRDDRFNAHPEFLRFGKAKPFLVWESMMEYQTGRMILSASNAAFSLLVISQKCQDCCFSFGVPVKVENLVRRVMRCFVAAAIFASFFWVS